MPKNKNLSKITSYLTADTDNGILSSNVSQTITGSLTVTGNLTAQQFIVSSSVTYLTQSFASGSNRFGNSSDDTHQFTGSMLLTGSLTVTTTGTEFQVNAGGVNLGNSLTDSHIVSGSVRINPNGLFVSSSGNVGIGNISPGLNLSVEGLYGMPVTSGAQTVGIFRAQDSASNIALDMGVIQNAGTWIQSGNKANSAVLPLVINPSGGNLLVGTTTDQGEKVYVNGGVRATGGMYGNFFEGEFGQVLASVSYGGTFISKNLAELDPGAYLIHAYMMRGGDGVNTTYSVLWYYMHLSGFGGGSDYITALYSNPGPQNNNGRIALTGAGYTVEITWGGARGPAAVTALKLRDGY